MSIEIINKNAKINPELFIVLLIIKKSRNSKKTISICNT